MLRMLFRLSSGQKWDDSKNGSFTAKIRIMCNYCELYAKMIANMNFQTLDARHIFY